MSKLIKQGGDFVKHLWSLNRYLKLFQQVKDYKDFFKIILFSINIVKGKGNLVFGDHIMWYGNTYRMVGNNRSKKPQTKLFFSFLAFAALNKTKQPQVM